MITHWDWLFLTLIFFYWRLGNIRDLQIETNKLLESLRNRVT